MLNWINKRRKEPTTYIGLSAFVYGIMTILKADGAEHVAQAIETVAPALTAGDYTTAGTLALGGLLAAVMGEKGSE